MCHQHFITSQKYLYHSKVCHTQTDCDTVQIIRDTMLSQTGWEMAAIYARCRRETSAEDMSDHRKTQSARRELDDTI